MSKFYAVDQGSGLWYQRRLGIPTASNFHRIVTPKGQPSRQAANYLYKLVAERLLNESQDDQLGYVNWVARGKEQEPNAVAHFQFVNEVELLPGGFVTTDDGRIGCSPDRLFKEHREAVEFKAPAPWTHIGYLLDGPADDYVQQVQGQIFVGAFEAVHFYSYHPQCPPYQKITLPDPGWQALLRTALYSFCDALDAATERARSLGVYAVSTRVETPGEVAYQASENEQLKLVVPDRNDE